MPVECLFIHQGGLSLLQLCLYTEGGCVYVCVFSDCGMLIVHLPIYTCTCMLPQACTMIMCMVNSHAYVIFRLKED